MKYDRTADVPVRHRLTDFVCTVGYSEYEEEFHFVSARYADPRKNGMPKDGFALYLRVLKEPALRATLFEALLPNERNKIQELREDALNERAKNYGFLAGLLALLLLGYGLYRLTIILARVVGYDTAEAITYLPLFFAFLVIFPVQHAVDRWYKRRYCNQHGHRLESLKNAVGSEVTWCRRCGLHLGSRSQTGTGASAEP